MSRISETISSRSALLTAIAMLAFAANSLLCRMALGQELIDAATFTSVRVVSGAVMLGLIVLFRGRTHEPNTADWRSAAMLFTYMAFFSFAYLSLSAGTGALILLGRCSLRCSSLPCGRVSIFIHIVDRPHSGYSRTDLSCFTGPDRS